MEQIGFIVIIILGIAGIFIFIQYHKTQEQRATLLGTALEKAESYIDKIQPLYERYWKEHMENLAIAILRVFGKDISIKDDKLGVTMDYRNAILFKEPVDVMPSHKNGAPLTIYGMSYDPGLDFRPMGFSPEDLQNNNEDQPAPEDTSIEDTSVEKAVDVNSKKILEWLSGTALIKGSHFGLRLITSMSSASEDEAEFGLMHFDDDSIVKLMHHFIKEVTGEEIEHPDLQP